MGITGGGMCPVTSTEATENAPQRHAPIKVLELMTEPTVCFQIRSQENLGLNMYQWAPNPYTLLHLYIKPPNPDS